MKNYPALSDLKPPLQQVLLLRGDHHTLVLQPFVVHKTKGSLWNDHQGIYRSPGGRFTMIPSSCEQQKAAIPEYDDLLVVIILVVKVALSQKVQDSFSLPIFPKKIFRKTILNYYIHYTALTKCQFSKHLLLHVQSIYRFKK